MEAKSEIPELPTEIICFQILSRLPTKLVVRCRCVCKSWASLTRHPSFLAVHRSFRCSPSTHLLFTASDETSEATTTLQHFYSVKLIQLEEGQKYPTKHLFSLPASPPSFIGGTQCINGLTFLVDLKVSATPFYVYNPCTEEIITLPRTNLIDDLFTHHLGFSAVTNEYKVLQVRWFGASDDRSYVNSLRFKIFALGTTSWRDIVLEFPFELQRLRFDRRSVCLHGGMHWIHTNQKIIVVFDVAAERFRANVPLPADCNCGAIFEVGGRVAVYDHFSFYQENSMVLWILEDYENHVWDKRTIVFPSCWRKLGCPLPLCTIHTGEILLRGVPRDWDDICVYLYNMESDSFRKCKISFPVNNIGPYPHLLASYDETSVISLRS